MTKKQVAAFEKKLAQITANKRNTGFNSLLNTATLGGLGNVEPTDADYTDNGAVKPPVTVT